MTYRNAFSLLTKAISDARRPLMFRSRQRRMRILRILAQSLLPLFFASFAHAQGTMDFSGATTLMQTFKTPNWCARR